MSDLSIYVHWPFCLAKCPYCDFNSHVAKNIDPFIWLSSYEKEIEYFSPFIKGKSIKSIFFGGGTPSLMDPKIVDAIIYKINELAIIDNNTEITLEANPTSFEIEKFKSFKAAGVNRVSIGVQSLREEDLKNLGRQHDVYQAKLAIEKANNIFSKVSFDLIYARSGQTLSAWQEELTEAFNFATGHISLYQLTIEKGTPFYKDFNQGKIILPEDEVAADMYEWTTNTLHKQGYQRYEISNYAKEGFECLHNLTYWHYNDYLGIGPGAHSRIKNLTMDLSSEMLNISSIMMLHLPERWLKSVNDIGNGIQTINLLNKNEIIEEFLMMGLRLKEGINFKEALKNIGLNLQLFIDQNFADKLISNGMIEFTQDQIFLTDKGLMMHNYIIPRLLKN